MSCIELHHQLLYLVTPIFCGMNLSFTDCRTNMQLAFDPLASQLMLL